MSQQTASAGRSSVKGKAGAAKADKPSVQLPDSPHLPPVPPLISLIKTALSSASDITQRLEPTLAALKNEIAPPPDPVDEGALKVEEEKAPEVVEEDVDPLFAAVREAVSQADSTIDKFCLKRRAGVSQTDAKKGVSSALEKLADDVWRAVAESMEKQAPSRAEDLLSQVQQDIESLKQALADTTTMLESLISIFQQTDESRGATREQLSGELQAEGQRLLESFQRYAATKRPNNSVEVRREMDELLGEMVTVMMASKGKLSYSEDAETFKLKKEVARIRQKVQTMCKSMEEGDTPTGQDCVQSTPVHARRGQSLMPEDIESMSERSSFRPHSHHSSISIDAEELKNEISKHLRQSHETLITELKEHKLGLSSMNQIQRTLQVKQDTMNSDVAEIKKRLFEMFPGGGGVQMTGGDRARLSDFSKVMNKLKTFGPEIRSNSDVEFLDKFTTQVEKDRKAMATFLSSLQSDGLNIVSLEEAASEISRLKSENQSLLEANEDSLLKMIRSQSEFEIETEFMRARLQRLETEANEPKVSSPVYTDGGELTELRDKVKELMQENARLKGDFFDASIVEPVPEALDYSKQDEVTYLKMQLSQKKQALRKLAEEKKMLEEKVVGMSANPQELIGLGEMQDAYERMAAEVKKLTTHIQRFEGGETPFTEEAELGAMKDLELKSVSQKMADYIRVVLNLTEGFEVCGTVTYNEGDWALVRVGSGFVWVKTDMERFTITNEEAVAEYALATQMLEGHHKVPKSPVLALGHLLEAVNA